MIKRPPETGALFRGPVVKRMSNAPGASGGRKGTSSSSGSQAGGSVALLTRSNTGIGLKAPLWAVTRPEDPAPA